MRQRMARRLLNGGFKLIAYDHRFANCILISVAALSVPMGAVKGSPQVVRRRGGAIHASERGTRSQNALNRNCVYFASWKIIPTVCRSPERTRLTPCRRLTR
jgi:hypothetical protein